VWSTPASVTAAGDDDRRQPTSTSAGYPITSTFGYFRRGVADLRQGVESATTMATCDRRPPVGNSDLPSGSAMAGALPGGHLYRGNAGCHPLQRQPPNPCSCLRIAGRRWWRLDACLCRAWTPKAPKRHASARRRQHCPSDPASRRVAGPAPHTDRVALNLTLIGLGWLLAAGSAVLWLRKYPSAAHRAPPSRNPTGPPA